MKSFTEIRESAGYPTKVALATEIETNPINITRWERGMRYPRPDMLLLLEKVLKVSAGEIIAAITAAKSGTTA